MRQPADDDVPTRPMRWGAGNPSTEWGSEFAGFADDGPGPRRYAHAPVDFEVDAAGWPRTVRLARWPDEDAGPAATRVPPGQADSAAPAESPPAACQAWSVAPRAAPAAAQAATELAALVSGRTMVPVSWAVAGALGLAAASAAAVALMTA